MTIVLLAEGDTERALKDHLKAYLDQQADAARQPRMRFLTRGRIESRPEKLRRQVELELENPDVTAVVGLIDVFPKFKDAAAAKQWLGEATGNNPYFYAHAAQYDVEAWLLPYWNDICRRLKLDKRSPGAQPEYVNSQKPPAYHLDELYRQAKPRARKYNKPIEMRDILRGKDLTVAADACPEFKSFLNTLLTLNGLVALQ